MGRRSQSEEERKEEYMKQEAEQGTMRVSEAKKKRTDSRKQAHAYLRAWGGVGAGWGGVGWGIIV